MSEPRIKGQSIVEKMLYENSNVSHTPGIIKQKYNRGGLKAGRGPSVKGRKVSESVPTMKKPILDIERQKYMKKERRKIEAEIDKYNKILRSQKNKNSSKNPIEIKRKIEMILGKEKASLGHLRRKQPYRREVNPKIKIYGKGMNNNSVKNVRL